MGSTPTYLQTWLNSPADIKALALVDEAYQDRTEWIKKSISTSAKMGKFSSDRAIQDYAQECWVRSFLDNSKDINLLVITL